MSNNHYSFEQWCIDNHRQDLLERWDKELNSELPSQISFKSNKKYWFMCPSKRHESSLGSVQDISAGKCIDVKCKKCNSFAQHIIDEYGEDYFNYIWSKDNELDPWQVAYKSNKKALLICEKNPKHIYPQALTHFKRGRCGVCHGNVHISEASLGQEFPQVKELWSEKNEKLYYDYNSHTQESVWWKCHNDLHDDYFRSITESRRRNFLCPECMKIKSHERPIEDLIGQQFGELVVLGYNKEQSVKEQRSNWICRCSCGKETTVDITSLKSGNTKSCGNRTIHYSGDDNGNWKGGITPELIAARTSTAYNNWREQVYAKDWYTCQCCGQSIGIDKEAHHFMSFALYPDLRFDVNNGITLCSDCHSAVKPGGFHYVYGVNNNSPQQLEKYINNRRCSLGIQKQFSLLEYQNGHITKPNELKIAL